jgi:hypothetical protein
MFVVIVLLGSVGIGGMLTCAAFWYFDDLEYRDEQARKLGR